jgi:4-amino-4-deoxy-L-arabinose transferase-like glycosyltransferase
MMKRQHGPKVKPSARSLPLGIMPRIPTWIFWLVLLLHLPALFIDVMDVDAAQYAEMAREMRFSDNWTFLYDRGGNYLDKPPMLFWLSALSMKLLGVSNWAYKLPSFLVAILAVYATYRLGRKLYGEAVGRWSALILATCQGLFLMINDVRTDTMLMGWVAVALWGWTEYRSEKRWRWLLLTAVAVALGLMTKGPIALFVPVFAIGADALLRRDWKLIFDPKYLVALLVIVLLLLPMALGLYHQYDAHPETIVDGKQGVSGLKFFFWTQSFGRITGASDWDNGAGPEFLLVGMLWAFLPWILLFLLALGAGFRNLFIRKFRLPEHSEGLVLGGFTLTYLSLCMSRYQLPHYIFVVFPLAAILVAVLARDFAEGHYPKWRAAFVKVQTGMGALLMVGVLLILTIVFPQPWWMLLSWAGCVTLWIYVTRANTGTARILWTSVTAILITNLFLTNFFYRPLLRYQLGGQVGRYLLAYRIPQDQVLAYRVDDPLNSLPFYSRSIIKTKPDSGMATQQRFPYVLTGTAGLAEMQRAGVIPDTLAHFERFKVSELTPTFLSAKARPEALTSYWLVKVR